MPAILALNPYLYQVIGKTVPPAESQVNKDKCWGYVLRSEHQTLRQRVNFYQCHSRTIQQAGGKIDGEELDYIYPPLVCDSGCVSVLRVRENARASSFNRCFHDSVIEEVFMLWKKTSKLFRLLLF